MRVYVSPIGLYGALRFVQAAYACPVCTCLPQLVLGKCRQCTPEAVRIILVLSAFAFRCKHCQAITVLT